MFVKMERIKIQTLKCKLKKAVISNVLKLEVQIKLERIPLSDSKREIYKLGVNSKTKLHHPNF